MLYKTEAGDDSSNVLATSRDCIVLSAYLVVAYGIEQFPKRFSLTMLSAAQTILGDNAIFFNFYLFFFTFRTRND